MREIITHETGIVTGLNDGMATVKVNRVVNLGRCCAKINVIDETLVEVKNLCNARPNDRVVISSSYDLVRYRRAVLFNGTFLSFAIGAAGGKTIFLLLGLSFGTPFSLSLGFVLGFIALLLIRNIFRKNPLPADAACKLMKAEEHESNSL